MAVTRSRFFPHVNSEVLFPLFASCPMRRKMLGPALIQFGGRRQRTRRVRALEAYVMRPRLDLETALLEAGATRVRALVFARTNSLGPRAAAA